MIDAALRNGNDAEFIQADKFIFPEIFNQFYKPLVFFARRLIHDEPVAEDIITDVFVKLWERLPGFQSATSIKGFLYICTRNACFTHLQQAKYQDRIRNILLNSSNESEDSIYETIKTEAIRQIFVEVEGLPAQCRKIILLCYLSGLNNHQIASRMKISVNTVRNQKVRGIDLVRRKLEASGKHRLIYID